MNRLHFQKLCFKKGWMLNKFALIKFASLLTCSGIRILSNLYINI
ncbi:unnamed protein product, partial [Larinioides sclopetarius]